MDTAHEAPEQGEETPTPEPTEHTETPAPEPPKPAETPAHDGDRIGAVERTVTTLTEVVSKLVSPDTSPAPRKAPWFKRG